MSESNVKKKPVALEYQYMKIVKKVFSIEGKVFIKKVIVMNVII